MNKTFPILAALLLGCVVMAGSALAVEKGPAEIILKSTVDPAKKEKLAFFPHAVHQGNFDCATCHHSKGDDGKQMPFTEEKPVAKCETCHNKAAVASGMPKKLETFKKVSHELCKGCHKSRTEKGEKAGPIKCNGCHRKDLK